MNHGSPGLSRETLHDLKQPLNVISLTVGNIRNRASQPGDALDTAYLAEKLGRIEQQVERASSMIDDLMATVSRGDAQPGSSEAAD